MTSPEGSTRRQDVTAEYKEPWWAWPAAIGAIAMWAAMVGGIIWIIAHFIIKYW